MKAFGKILIALLSFLTLCYIGLPSRLLNIKIDNDKFIRIKEINQILIKAQIKVQHDTVIGLTQFLPFGYGRIVNSKQVDQLFPFLPDIEKAKIKSLFDQGEITEIDMHLQSCISYKLKVSWNNYIINSSHEVLYLIHNNKCDCECENMSHEAEDKLEKQSLGDGWFKVDMVIVREHFRG